MENSFRSHEQQKDDTEQPRSFFSILHWLVSLIRLTEKERNDAGIYIRGRESDDCSSYIATDSYDESIEQGEII